MNPTTNGEPEAFCEPPELPPEQAAATTATRASAVRRRSPRDRIFDDMVLQGGNPSLASDGPER